ncbi:ankyrin-3-like [Diabrotica virgifera virgifera]|uniref:Ankyrin-3-like n=1 Tax=Diabrotica virgifera virgifera TaxID=50390 RepID=A0ABM5KVB8_DIAVI|nr:ankyrin-3-like [Diabrotica virgifera virgifera]
MDSSESLLMLAIEDDDCAEVAILLDKGVVISYIEPAGFSPLFTAVYRGNLETVELLLKRNANVNANVNTYENRFVQYVPPLLHLAAWCGRLDVLTLLIAYGASLETKCINGLLPIHIAAEGGCFNIVKYFIENKLYHVNTTCRRDLRTPLMYAVTASHTEIVEYLGQYNADVNTADVSGNTALHFACLKNLEDIINILIRKGSNLDAKRGDGETPLQICVRQGNLSAARRLIESGARSYLERGVSGNSPMHLAVQYNQKEMLEYFFKMGISADFQTVRGYSLLHEAVECGKPQMVEFLLQNGANTESKMNSFTALHMASTFMYFDVIQVLLNNGADVMAVDKNGQRPLDFLYENFIDDVRELESDRIKCCTELLVKHMLLFYKYIEVSKFDKFPCGASIDEFKQKCQEEIEQMKTCLIKNTTVSLYTFLQALRNKNKLLIFLRNHELQEELNNVTQYIDKYPIYSSLLPMILDEVHNGMERLLLLEKAGTAMDIIVPNLILECKINILQMLNNKDLSSLIESVKV